MNILMMTNTYLPHVGGVARSVDSCATWLRSRAHRVLIGAPRFEGAPRREPGVVRIPAIQHFNGSDFSVPLPITRALHRAVERFRPDLVHSHHPFLLGDTALRIAAEFDLPIVFTHHTLYERFTHYVPLDSPSTTTVPTSSSAMRRVIARTLSSGEATCTDRTRIAPADIADLPRAAHLAPSRAPSAIRTPGPATGVSARTVPHHLIGSSA